MSENSSPENQFNELQEFSFKAIHDLKAPIRGVNSFLQLLDKKNKANWDAKDQKYIDFIKKSTSRMQNLVQDLVNYYKVTIQELPVEEVDLEELISGTFDDSSLRTENSKLVYSKLPMVRGSKLALGFLFTNLIENALTYIEEGTEAIIEIKVSEHEKSWEFHIVDNGIGIHKDDFEVIFTPLTRLHSDMRYPGTGLGLAICKKVTDLYDGNISLTSELGVGSSFVISLPKL